MKRAEVMRALEAMDRQGVWAFTTRTFSAMMGGVEPNYLKVALKRLSDPDVRIVERVVRGVYFNPRARSMPDAPREAIVPFLRPREYSYLSFETLLSQHGIISQHASALTVGTSGPSGRFATPWGDVEFTRVREEISPERGVWFDAEGRLPIASAGRAWRDLSAARRSLDLVDRDLLEEVIEEQAAALAETYGETDDHRPSAADAYGEDGHGRAHFGA